MTVLLNEQLLQDPRVKIGNDRVIVTDLKNKRKYFFTEENIKNNPQFIVDLVESIKS